MADFTGTAADDTFNATMATMQSLDAIAGGDGKDTLNIRDTAAITSRAGSHTGIEVLNVTSTAGSVGQVAAAATIAARQQFTIDFTSAVFVGAATTTLTVTMGGIVRTVAIGATVADTATAVGAAIESILDESLGTSTAAPNYTAVVGNVVTVTAATPGVAVPAVTIAAGTATITTAPVSTTIQANQVVAAAVDAATFSAMADVTDFNVTAATTANVSSVSTAATIVSAGGVVVLSGGASQTVGTAGSVQVSGSTGAVAVTVAGVPAGTLAAVSNTGWSTAAAGVFVRGGSSVTVTETAGTSTAGSVPAGNATKIQVGADPTAASGTAGANAGAIVSSIATGAEVIGNLSSAATGNVSTVERTLYTGNNTTNTVTNGLTNVRYGTGDVKLYMNGGSTASVTGASTVSVTDVQTVLTKASTLADALPGTSKLTTVNLTGVSSTTAIKSDAIATVSAVDTTSIITVTSNTGANTGGVALNVANSAVTLVHANATSVSVGGAAGSGRQAIANTPIASTQDSTVTLTAAKASALAFSGANTVTLAGSALGELTSITSTASGTVNLGTATGYAKLTSVNMSAGSGSVTATLGATITGAATDRAFTYTGSAGADTVVLTGEQKAGTSAAGAAITNTISLGAGNDVLVKAGAGAVGAGATVDGGAGVDTVAASLLNVGNASRITGFELLGLDVATAYDTDLLVGAAGFVLLAHGGTYTNAEKAQSLTVASNVGVGTTTIQFTAAQIAGSADAYGVNFAAAGSAVATAPAAINAGTLVIAGIEDVSISSGAASGFVSNTIALTAANLKTVTVTGSAAETTLVLGASGTNAGGGLGGGVTAIEAGALTGKLTINTTGLTVNDATGSTGLVVNSGAGDDAITIGQTAIVNTGAGKDVITFSAGAGGTVNAGAGDDVITLTAAGGVITLGAGADEVNVGSALGAVTRIVDFSAADKVDFINATDGTHSATAGALAKLTLTTETTLDQLFTSAGLAATGAVEVVWFSFGGNTYAVYDKDNSGTYTAAGDVVVRFDGVVDLTGYSFDAVNGSLAFV